MALLYADENFDAGIVEELRLLGHEVLTVQDANQRGGDDAIVLAYATAGGRAVLTHNRKDFVRLHSMTPSHGGIIVVTWDSNHTAVAKRIDQAIQRVTALRDQLFRVNRPQTP